jgi:alpha-beta hydrolase superfamily lysophospholipase
MSHHTDHPKAPRLGSAAFSQDSDDERVSFFDVLGHSVRVSQRSGQDADAVPLLLLMGLGGNIEMWEPLRTELTERGVSTIAIDVPGTGGLSGASCSATAGHARPHRALGLAKA